MMTIVGIIICCITLIIIAFLNTEGPGEQVGKVGSMAVILFVMINLVYDVSYDFGIKDGAYNQLRGKYEVNYVIDKDSCVVDTIINLD